MGLLLIKKNYFLDWMERGISKCFQPKFVNGLIQLLMMFFLSKGGKVNRVPGEMGKRDMIIVEAIYESIREGGKKNSLDLKICVLEWQKERECILKDMD